MPPVGRLLSIPAFQLASFVAEGWSAFRQESPYPEVPPLAPSLPLIGEAILDRTFTLGVNVMTGVPHPDLMRRAQEESERARAFMGEQGWLDDPLSYHRTPPHLERVEAEDAAAWSGRHRMRFQHVRFESGYLPPLELPNAERWLELEPNAHAHAWVLEHDGPPRPWVVCVHGFGMGSPNMDLMAFQAKLLHEELGLNLAMPCLPLHGPRSDTRFSGAGLLQPDYLNMLHLFSQAVWDIRRLISWIRDRGAEKVGLYGISLGGYTVSLVASIEEGLDAVIAGIPAVDFVNLARDNEPWAMKRLYDDDLEVDWQLIRELMYVVSPLALAPRVEHEGRYIFAGVADRVVRPDQARALWRHWGRPEIHWFSGGHVASQMKDAVGGFVENALRSALLDAA